MRIAIVTYGTRGDVQPLVALGAGLRAQGHDILVVTGEPYRTLTEAYGLSHAGVFDGLSQVADFHHYCRTRGAKGPRCLQIPGFLAHIWKQAEQNIFRMLQDGWQAVQGAEVVICHTLAAGGVYFAEKLGAPCFMVESSPLYMPTRAFPTPRWRHLPAGGGWNRFSHHAALRTSEYPALKILDRWQRDVLRLPSKTIFAKALVCSEESSVPTLCSYSPHVLPRPSDWPSQAHVTGYLFLPDESAPEPPPRLERFLADGPPPIYVSFGNLGQPEHLPVILRVLDELKLRAVLGHPWSEAQDLPPGVIGVGSVSFGWLLPQVAAVVHHGGAGTLGEVLRAGKPSVICPTWHEQAFWGRIAQRLCVSARPIPLKRLTAGRLRTALDHAVNDKRLGARASQLAAKLAQEDGVQQAIDVMGRYVPALNAAANAVLCK